MTGKSKLQELEVASLILFAQGREPGMHAAAQFPLFYSAQDPLLRVFLYHKIISHRHARRRGSVLDPVNINSQGDRMGIQRIRESEHQLTAV